MIIIAFSLLIIILCVAIYKRIPKKPPQVITCLKKAKLIYKDGHRMPFFSCPIYKIRARPDFIYSLNGKTILVEYKSRFSAVTSSDKAQLIATAIAVKAKFPNLATGYIYTRRGDTQAIDLNSSVQELASQISCELQAVRAIEANRPFSFQPQANKCNACSYNQVCRLRV